MEAQSGGKGRADSMRRTYTLVRCMAHSELGDVFMGEDDSTGEQVCVHVVEMESVERNALATGSKRIVQYSQCKSPHVKAFLSSYVIPGTTKLCLVSEYMERTVKDVLRVHKTLSENAISEAIRAVLAGLSYLHDKGMAHKNVKASSILLNESMSEVKLGAPEVFDRISSQKSSDLEPPYWPVSEVNKCRPGGDAKMDESRAEISEEESVEGVRVCPTSQDIWSVGVVALEMATGSHPFSEGEKNELVTGQDSAINVPNTLSKALQHFISSCLIEDAAARPSALALLEHRFITKSKRGARLSDYAVQMRSANQVLLALTPRFPINVPEINTTLSSQYMWDFERANFERGHTVHNLLDRLSWLMVRSIHRSSNNFFADEGSDAREQASEYITKSVAGLKQAFTDLLCVSEREKIESSLAQYMTNFCDERVNAEYQQFWRAGGIEIQQGDLDLNRYMRLGVFARFAVSRWSERHKKGINL